MRNLKMLILLIAVIFLLVACMKPDDFLIENQFGVGPQHYISSNQTLTIPFVASFVTYGANSGIKEVAACGLPPVYRISVKGYGKAAELGNITIPQMSFCCNIESGEYWNAVGSIVTDNGDELFLKSGGQIISADTNDPPYYLEKWNDPFSFTGGTGRFEGATGGGMTHSYNSNIPGDSLNHQFWIGSLTLLYKKQ